MVAMRTRHILPAIVAIALGSAVALAASRAAVDSHINRGRFTLAGLDRTGVMAGAGATGLVLGVGLAIGRKPNPQQDVIRFLEGQTGRGDLTDDQRAALAYVAQDLRDSSSK